MKLDEVTGILSEPRTFIPSPLLPTNDFVGIEVELEGFGGHGHELNFESSFWTVKDDPSLRAGKEFVYNQPLCGQDVITSLEEFETFIEWFENKFNDIDCSERTSMHVHLDIRSFTSSQLLNLSLVTMTFEPALIKLFGPDRADSNYCLPMHKSADRFRLAALTKDDAHSVMTGLQGSKYSSFNTLPVAGQGSVEFRLHTGTKDASAILNWVCVILWLKKYARDMKLDYLKFPEYVSEKGLDTFVREVFHDRADQFLYQGFQEDLWDGIRVAQDTVIRNQLREAHERAIDYDEINPAIAAFAGKNKVDELDDCKDEAPKLYRGLPGGLQWPNKERVEDAFRGDPIAEPEWVAAVVDEDGHEEELFPPRAAADNGAILAAAGVNGIDLDFLERALEGEEQFDVEI